MLIELAHYTLLFALTVVGLQTFLLCPTLWSGGSAVTIKLGFRGICFTAGLLLFSFFTLLSGFAAHDFSLAVVFETFDSRTSPFYALQAFCSAREGLFFTFIIFFTVILLSGFSKRDLATYQERGRYLFAGGFLIFSWIVLMLATADPFIRIEEPPFEGIGFKPEWRPPHQILFTLFSFSMCACLTVSFIKMLCIYSKGRQFVRPVLCANLIAAILTACALGIELITGFATVGNGTLFQWTPVNGLLLSVLLLSTGQIILLFFNLTAAIFINWIIFSSFLATVFSNAYFLTVEYRLFTQSNEEAYFPNPLAALCALAGIVCFLLFLNSVTLKKNFKETGFSVFSRESFVGLAFAGLMAAAFSIGSLSLLPALFMFLPDLPLRLLPALTQKTLFITMVFFSVFFFIAFRRKSRLNGWADFNKRSAKIFSGLVLILAVFCFSAFPEGGKIAAYTLPSVLLLGAFAVRIPVSIPSSVSEAIDLLKTVPAFKYGLFFCVTGFFIFSAMIACASLNRTETTTTLKLPKTTGGDFPCSVEQMTEKAANASARYRLVCPAPLQLLSGDLNFQWRENELKASFLQTERFSIRLIRADQTAEDTLRLRVFHYPVLQLAVSGVFLICLGLFFLLFSVKKETTTL